MSVESNSNIRESKFSEITPKYNQDQCPICHDRFESDQKIHKLACDHIFHADCSNQAMERNMTCSVCRAPIQHNRIEEGEVRRNQNNEINFEFESAVSLNGVRTGTVNVSVTSNNFSFSYRPDPEFTRTVHRIGECLHFTQVALKCAIGALIISIPVSLYYDYSR